MAGAKKGAAGKRSSSAKHTAHVAAKHETASPGQSPWSLAVVALSGLIAFVLLAGWVLPLTAVVVPLLVGAYVGLRTRTPITAVVLGAVVGLLGALIATSVYAQTAAIGYLMKMPQWINPDFPLSVYEKTTLPLFSQLPWGSDLAIVAVLGSTLVAGCVAGAVRWALDKYRSIERLPMIVAWVTVVVLAAAFLYTANSVTTDIRQQVSAEPADLSYGYDAFIYLKTFYLMDKGQSYYPAVVAASAGDARFAAEGIVKDGKMFGFWPTPSYFRQPLPFYLWTWLAANGAQLMLWSQMLSALALLALFWGFSRQLSTGALLVPMVVYPWLVLSNAWLNVFFPDWWAALAMLFAVALLAADMGVAAVVVAFIATLLRFSTLPLLGTIVASALVLALFKVDRRRMLIVFGTGVVALVAFVVLWKMHTAAALPFVDPQTFKNTPTQSILSGTAGRDFNLRAIAPMHYGTYAYGFHAFPLVVLFVPALVGFGLALWKKWLGALSLTLFVGAWLVFSAFIGPTASYWGQVYNIIVIIGAVLVLAGFERAGEVGSDVRSWWGAWRAHAAEKRTRPKGASA